MSALSNAVVVGSCLVSFSQSVRFQDQQDIQDCLLYAELAANDKYPERVSEKVWFDYYQGRLLKAGFTLRVIVPSTPFRASNADQLLSINHTVVGKLGYERLGQLIDDTYRALKLDNIAWEFFQGNVARDGLGILKTAPCERLDSGETVVCLFGIRYSTVVIKPELFWTDSGKEVVVIPDGGVFAFDRVQFLQFRARVHEKIDAYSDKALVRKLKL